MLARSLVVVLLGTAPALQAQSVVCVSGGTGGPFPLLGTGGGGSFPSDLPPHAGVYTLNVPALPVGASVVSEIKLNGLTHTYAGDLHFTLTSPSGVAHNLSYRRGGTCDLAGDYVFVPGCSTPTLVEWSCGSVIPPGVFAQFFGLWPEGEAGLVNVSIGAIPAVSGVWTLSIYDWTPGDVGGLNSWELCFGAAPSPAVFAPAGAPTATTPPYGSLRFGPEVKLAWYGDPCATSYDVEVDGVVVGASESSSMNYASSPGGHSWRVRSRNVAGVGAWSEPTTYFDLGLPPATCEGSSLATLFDRDSSSGSGSILYFDVDVLRPSGILVSELDTNTTKPINSTFGLEVYLKAGTHVGATSDAGAWTLISSGTGVSQGPDAPSLVDVDDFQIPFGLHALGLRITGGGHAFSYASGASSSAANADVALTFGQLQHTAFVSFPNPSRVWNGALRYDCIPEPAVYCTGGTTSNACSASITASGQPSATLATPCRILVERVEGQKQGLVFYGVDNAGFAPLPWGGASSSFLCVRPPTERGTAMNSGGAAGVCNGVLGLDWNAHQNAHPASLGSPFSVGDKVYVQGWFRDPLAPLRTNLSNALELTVRP